MVWYNKKVIELLPFATEILQVLMGIPSLDHLLGSSKHAVRVIHIIAIGILALVKESIGQPLNEVEKSAINGFARDLLGAAEGNKIFNLKSITHQLGERTVNAYKSFNDSMRETIGSENKLTREEYYKNLKSLGDRRAKLWTDQAKSLESTMMKQ